MCCHRLWITTACFASPCHSRAHTIAAFGSRQGRMGRRRKKKKNSREGLQHICINITAQTSMAVACHGTHCRTASSSFCTEQKGTHCAASPSSYLPSHSSLCLIMLSSLAFCLYLCCLRACRSPVGILFHSPSPLTGNKTLVFAQHQWLASCSYQSFLVLDCNDSLACAGNRRGCAASPLANVTQTITTT